MSKKMPTRRDGVYHLPGGLKLPSVTEIVSAVPKPYLIPWGAKVAARAIFDDPDKYDTAEKAAAAVTTTKSDAGTRGRAVHDLVEAWAHGATIDIAEEYRGYQRAFETFLKAWRPEPILTEATVWNATYGYAGRLDSISKIGSENFLLDFKTSKAVYAEYRLQVTAYRKAEFYVLDPNVDVPQALPEIQHTAIVLLEPSGTFNMTTINDTEHLFEVFLHVKGVWEWLKEQGH